jgi:hypothetical protein
MATPIKVKMPMWGSHFFEGISSNLKRALLISLSVHALVCAPCVPHIKVPRSDERAYSFEVDYVRVADDTHKVRAAAVPAQEKDAGTQQGERLAQAAQAEQVKNEASAPIAPRDGVSGPSPADTRAKDVSREVSAQRPVSPVAQDQKQVQRRDDTSYYQLVREKIRRTLKSNYKTGASREGNAYLEFTIDRAGNLIRFSIDGARSTSDKVLLKIVEVSLKEAAPFPPLPDDVRRDRLTFNILISFKER